MTLLTCPEPGCHRAWFTRPNTQRTPDAAPDLLLQHLRRSHRFDEHQAVERLHALGLEEDPA